MELSVRRLFFVGRRLRYCSNPPAYVSLTFVQKKTASVSLHQRFFHGRGWITQAAHLKRPRRGLFAAGTQSAGPYELRLPIFLQPLGGALKNRSAAPASPPCFRRRRTGCGTQHPLRLACVSLAVAPTTPRCFRRWRRSSSLQSAPLLFESTLGYALKSFGQKKNSSIFTTLEFLVGAGGFEPPKLKSSRFTVCPHWPLGNTPIYSFSQSRTACIYYHSGAHLSTAFYSFFRKEADRTAQSRGRP